jgi:hypothetical protein
VRRPTSKSGAHWSEISRLVVTFESAFLFTYLHVLVEVSHVNDADFHFHCTEACQSKITKK